MIFSFLATRAGKFAAAGLAVILAVLAFLWWIDAREKAAVEADRAVSSAKAVSTAREADERADEAAAGAVAGIQKGNDDAKAAAAGSDDPLADGLRSLRRDAKGSDRPSGR